MTDTEMVTQTGNLRPSEAELLGRDSLELALTLRWQYCGRRSHIRWTAVGDRHRFWVSSVPGGGAVLRVQNPDTYALLSTRSANSLEDAVEIAETIHREGGVR